MHKKYIICKICFCLFASLLCFNIKATPVLKDSDKIANYNTIFIPGNASSNYIWSSGLCSTCTLVASGVVTDFNCGGGNTGSATVTASGGTTPYTYIWSPGGYTSSSVSILSAQTYTVTVYDNSACPPVTVAIVIPSGLNANMSITNYNCGGTNTGAIKSTPSGGTSPYTYSWSNFASTSSIAALSNGTYTLTVRDKNGCTSTGSVFIPSGFNNIISITDYNCGGGNTGAIQSVTSGGTSPYTYSWSTSATTTSISALSNATYTLTVKDNNGCISTGNAIIPSGLNANISITNYNCGGANTGAIKSIPSGGTSPYTYSWSTGGTTTSISILSAGTYTLTVTDKNGCTSTGSAVIPSGLSSNMSITDYNCGGGNTGAIQSVPTGGTTPYSYHWSTSATTSSISGLGSGTYTLTVTDKNGCTSTGSVVISSGLNANISITDYNCGGANTGAIKSVPIGGTSPYTYSWSTGATTTSVNSLGAAIYTITVTDKNGCSGTGSVIIPAGLNANATIIYNDSCHGLSDGSATVVSTGGTTPYTYLWTPSGGVNATASNLSAGIYTAKVTDNNGCTASSSIIITQPAAVTVSISSFVNPCPSASTGIINTTESGGTQPFTYTWSGGASSQTTSSATGLSSGTYTITVIDAHGCYVTAYQTLIALSASIPSQNNISCHGLSDGSANIVAINGNPPYAYSWSNGQTTTTVTGLSALTYTVSTTDNQGCSFTNSVTITQPGQLTVSATVTSFNCAGTGTGAINATAASGTQPWTYSWSNGKTTSSISSLSAGTYTITIKDFHGCTATTSAVINPGLTVTANITAFNCDGGNSGAISAAGQGGNHVYTYLWNPGGKTTSIVSGLSSGVYTVTISDSQCPSADDTIIPMPSAIQVSLPLKRYVCSGDTIRINGNPTGGDTNTYATSTKYQWKIISSRNGNSIIDTTHQTVTFISEKLDTIGSTTVLQFNYTTDEFRCKDSGTVQVITNPVPLKARADISSVCSGALVPFDLIDTLNSAKISTYYLSCINQNVKIYGSSSSRRYFIQFPSTTGEVYIHVTQITDNGCSRKDSIGVNVTASSIPPLIVIDTIPLGSSYLLVCSDTTASRYQWYRTDTCSKPWQNDSIIGGQNQSLQVKSPDSTCAFYSCKTYYTHGCSTITFFQAPHSAPSSIENIIEIPSSLTVIPNPNSGSFKVRVTGKYSEGKLMLFDVLGRAIYQQTYSNDDELFINTKAAPGMYMLIYNDKNGRPKYYSKVMIQK